MKKKNSSSKKANPKKSKPPKKFILTMKFWECILNILRIINEIKDLFW